MKLLLTISVSFFLLQVSESTVNANSHSQIRFDADSLVAFAKTFIGTPYRYGGNTPQGFDCSGFVSFVFAHFNFSLPRSSVDYTSVGVPVLPDSCMKGDIILFSGTDNDLSKIGHVGIITSNPGETLSFIHSSSSKKHRGIIISELKGTGYIDRFIGIRRLDCYIPNKSN
jgi:cell wall-associated NlpC family hydrolase